MYMKHVINSTQWLSVKFWGKGLLIIIEIIIGCIVMSAPKTKIPVLYEGSCWLNSMGNTTHILLMFFYVVVTPFNPMRY